MTEEINSSSGCCCCLFSCCKPQNESEYVVSADNRSDTDTQLLNPDNASDTSSLQLKQDGGSDTNVFKNQDGGSDTNVIKNQDGESDTNIQNKQDSCSDSSSRTLHDVDGSVLQAGGGSLQDEALEPLLEHLHDDSAQNFYEFESITRDPVILEIIEFEFGLVDHLRSSGCLEDQVCFLLLDNAQNSQEKIRHLVQNLNKENVEKFLEGLKASCQSHLANYIRHKGVKPKGLKKTEWPIDAACKRLIDLSYTLMINEMSNKEILERLLKYRAINDQHYRKILQFESSNERNSELLGIIKRRSDQQFSTFLECLKKINLQLHKIMICLKDSGEHVILAQIEYSSESTSLSDQEVYVKLNKVLNKLPHKRTKEDNIRVIKLANIGGKIYAVFNIDPKMESDFESLALSALNEIVNKSDKLKTMEIKGIINMHHTNYN